MKKKWTFLSHKLSASHPAYGNGIGFKSIKTNSICCGNTSNNSSLDFPVHLGTHLDFPYHFSDEGKFGDDYKAEDFIFENVEIIELKVENIKDYKISIEDFDHEKMNPTSEVLIVKTGMCNFLNTDAYWNQNPCFEPELAGYFKRRLPNLKIFGFDTISLTGRSYREEGRKAHIEFLIEHDILILEDMDLSFLDAKTTINKIVISPLRFEKMDGAPVTVLAKIDEI